MIAFAMSHSMSQGTSHTISSNNIGHSNCLAKNTNWKKECNNNYVNIDRNLNFYQYFTQISFKNTPFTFSNIFNINIWEFKNKNLYKIHSPPNYKRKIKFYSYSHLVKIIKSNT